MNYYELLGVSSTATEDEIKKAYKEQIKKWHPDVNSDEKAVSITIKLNEAKKVLLDSEKRKEYDVFLNKKETDAYQKYCNVNYEETPKKETDYEEKMVTKWEYLKNYLNCKNISLLRRFMGLVMVLLESTLCFLLKIFIIALSFLCYFLSNIIILSFKYISSVILILVFYLVFIILTQGYNKMLENSFVQLQCVLILIIVCIMGIVLPKIGDKLISKSIFEFLYNKLDVFLFKKSVGYK